MEEEEEEEEDEEDQEERRRRKRLSLNSPKSILNSFVVQNSSKQDVTFLRMMSSQILSVSLLIAVFL